MATPQLYYKNGNSWQSAMLNSYPVGAIYSSTSSTNPGSIFGGGWVQLKDLDPLLATIDDSQIGRYIGSRFLAANHLSPHWHPIANMQSHYPNSAQGRFVKLYRQNVIGNGNQGGDGWLIPSDDPRSTGDISTTIAEAMYASSFINGQYPYRAGQEQTPLTVEGYGTYIWHRIS